MSNGPKFWDSLCGPQGTVYPEYVNPDIWFGEYVSKLEGDKQAATATASDDSRGAGSGSSGTQVQQTKLPRWKRRTPAQIEANKAAQKRFREKKKAKLQQASSKVEELSEKAKSLEALNRDVAALEQENAELEASLWTREAEIYQIKLDLNEKTPQAVYDQKLQSRCIPSFVSRPPSLEDQIEKVAQRWLREKDSLEQLLTEKQLAPPSTTQLSASQTKEVEKRSLAVIAQCMEIMNLGGPQLDALLRTLADRHEDLMRQQEISKYAALAQFLELSSDQFQQLLETRANVMQRLERIYYDRQGLNMRVMALSMVAQQPAANSNSVTSSPPQQRAVELQLALGELRKNLQEEQRLESEHHYIIFRKILSPLQGAWFIIKAYPAHCDTVAFMHGVAELQGQGPLGTQS